MTSTDLNRKPPSPPFVSVLGCCRSGTSLLATLLERYYGVAIPFESHFIPLFQRYIWLWGDLSKSKNRRRLLDTIFDFVEIFTHAVSVSSDMPEHAKYDYEKIKKFSLLAAKDHADEIVENSDSYPSLVDRLFAEYAAFHDLPLWGDKSASFRHVPMSLIANALPKETKFIHIVRDGRDVCLSWRKIWNGPFNAAETALLWREHNMKKDQWGMGQKDRFMQIRYEDLLADEEKTMAAIGAFLGCERVEDETSRETIADALAESSILSKVSGEVQKENMEKWRGAMTEEDQSVFEYLAEDALDRFSYTHSSCAPRGGMARRQQLTAWLRALLSPRDVVIRVKMNFLKPLLPAVLFCTQVFRIPLVKIFAR